MVLQVTGKLHPKHSASQFSVNSSKVEEIKKPRRTALPEVLIRLFKLNVFHPLVLLNQVSGYIMVYCLNLVVQ